VKGLLASQINRILTLDQESASLCPIAGNSNGRCHLDGVSPTGSPLACYRFWYSFSRDDKPVH
jgi:hypothetical protein